jgi:UDP-glucose 4-epimerase
MTILVTGGAGFIGSHIVERFHQKCEVRVLDNLRSGFARNLQGFKHQFIQGSILERATVRKAMEGVDAVFHLAAMVSVPESMKDPVGCNDLNTVGTLIVLQEAARAKVKRLVFSSSAAVYGDNPEVPKHEAMLPEPKSPYAITKLDGEFYCKLFTDEGWLSTACLRYFNVFGPRQDPGSQYAAAIPIFIHRALNNEPLIIHGDGEQTRDFVFVKDVVTANAFVGMESKVTGVLNVACGQRITINALAKAVIDLTGSKSAIVHNQPRPGDIRDSIASIEKLRNIGFTPETPLGEGLEQTVRYFRALRDG